jgi:hypothetical protein
MKEHDIVRVVAIRDDRFSGKSPDFQRHPKISDVGTIVADYGIAFEVECCDAVGRPIWLCTMFADELQKETK